MRRVLRLDDVPAREVAAPGVHHVSRLLKPAHRLPYFLPRCAPVDVVHLVQVDVVRL
jgi:hypothetical protein